MGISRIKRQLLWQVYCKRNEPMPGSELKGMGASRGNRVLKAKNSGDKCKFPPPKWWETQEWEMFCVPSLRSPTRGRPIGDVIEEIFQKYIKG